MAAKRNASPSRKPQNRGANSIFAVIGTLLLWGLGMETLLFGVHTAAAEYFEYLNRYGAHITIGSLGFDDPEGFRILEGPEAIYFGIAFCALGVMFGLWGFGMGLSIFAPKKSSESEL